MSSTLYEIVELSDGEFVLRRAEDEAEGEPLVSISFSEEALYFLNSSKFDVARAMIEAGLEAASDQSITETSDSHQDLDGDVDETHVNKTIH